MYYLLLSFAALMFALQFMFNKSYQSEEGNSFGAALKFILYTSLVAFVLLLAINKFKLEISLFSILTAVVLSIVMIYYTYSSINAFKYANLSVYSVFAMIGGMVLPFLYGLILGEEFKLIRIVCLMLIMFAVTLSMDKGAFTGKSMKYYIEVFILNGMIGVISKFHQQYTDWCVDSGSFIIISKIVSIIICVALILCNKNKDFRISIKAFAYSGIYSVLNGVGNLIVLISLLHLPASVQYPMITGGVIVFSVLIDIARKVKVKSKELIAAGIACIASIFMAF